MSKVITNGAPVEALQACESVGFPLLTDEDCDSGRVKIVSGECGREGYLPQHLFEPTDYDVPQDNPKWVRHGLEERWNNLHARSVLNRYHGPGGEPVISVVATELFMVAALQNQATKIWTALRILPEQMTTNGKGETLLSVWDNGRPYESYGAMARRFTLGSAFGELKLAGTLPSGDEEIVDDIYATLATVKVARSPGGLLTILSGSNRLDISANKLEGENEPTYLLTQSECVTPIAGNLVVARMPHRPDAKQ